MMQTFESFIDVLNDYLYSFLLTGTLVCCSIYFTVRSRCLQLRMFGEMCHLLVHREPTPNRHHITPLQAFLVSLAGRVGTGNIAGVAIALTAGGPGAVVWMWVIALIASATAFWEGTLAQLYKQQRERGFVGGPAYYMHYGLGRRHFSHIFALMSTVSLGLVCNSVHSNTVCLAFEEGYSIQPPMMGILLSAAALIIFIGGLHRIVIVCSYIVPAMALGYVALSLYVVFTHITTLPDVLYQMFAEAFGLQQAIGGGIAAAFVQGVKRGLYSNEAGWGTAPNVAATASTSHPVKQGLIQAVGVFVDTLIICSCTAFIIQLSEEPLTTGTNGIQLTQRALAAEVGQWSVSFVAFAVLLFAMSTLLSNYYYGENNLRYLTKSRRVRYAYLLVATAMVMAGSLLSFGLIWSLADLVMALMTFMNLYALVRLTPRTLALLRHYQRQRQQNGDPHFFN
jgi:AGCS family alanine or glycine:cation symporter